MVNKIDFVIPSLKDIYQNSKGKMLRESLEEEKTFFELLKESISKLNSHLIEAEKTAQEFILGKRDIQEVLIAIEKANLEFRLAVQIRNKLIEAYQEIMRMQI